MGQENHVVLADLLGLDHDADLAARLDGVCLVDAGIGAGQLLQLLQTANVVFHILTAGAGAGSGDGVGGLHQTSNDRLGLHVAVVGLDGVDDDGAFLVLPGQLHTQLHVAALHLMGDGLAQIVKQTGPLGQGHIDAQLAGHQTGDMGHLDGVAQDVLAVAGAVPLTAQELHQLRVQVVDTGLVGGALALHLDGVLHLAAGLLHHVLDAGGMDAAVDDELLQSHAGHFAADGVKAGNGDGFGGVVDDQIDAGDGLEGADVAALAANDAALHIVVGQGDHGNGGFGRVIGGTALNGGGDDLAGPLIGFLLELGLHLVDLHGRLMTDLGFHIFQQVGFGLLLAQTGDLFQDLHLAALELVRLLLGGGHLLQLVVQFLFPLFVGVQLAVEGFLFLLQAALLLLQVGAALLHFFFVFGTRFMDFFLGLQQQLSVFVLRRLDGFIDQAFCLLFGAADLLFGNLFAIGNADKKEHHRTDKADDDRKNDLYRFHNSANTPP